MGLIVDNFAGGGGASTGIEAALGRKIDIAINHDPAAILMHKTNHPETKHYCESVWEVDLLEATQGQEVDLAWFSPDCKHFSKAKGGKPVDKNVRGLAWVAVKWAKLVKPKVIILENVEEFKTWGPIVDNMPDPKKRGQTFMQFIKALENFGYEVDYRELKACDYGAPTTRKRLFLIARCDGQKIIWPEPTHGDPDSIFVKSGILEPYKTAEECIDWSIPCNSIFDRKKPLAENTLKRIARGIQKFVIEAEEPYILDDKAMFLQHYYGQQGEETRASGLNEPVATISTANRFGLVTAFIAKHYGGNYKGAGISLENGLDTITTVDHHSLVTAFLLKYYGADIGQNINGPLHTITSKDRFGLVSIKGSDYQVVDIGMRMLHPKELYKAQGFPGTYIIDHDYTGKAYPKTEQVARVGNSVCPQVAEAIVRANVITEEDQRAV